VKQYEVGQIVWIWMHREEMPKHGVVIEVLNVDNGSAWNYGRRNYVLLMEGKVEVMEDYRCFPTLDELQEYETKSHGTVWQQVPR
jgi:hypothetical protein